MKFIQGLYFAALCLIALVTNLISPAVAHDEGMNKLNVDRKIQSNKLVSFPNFRNDVYRTKKHTNQYEEKSTGDGARRGLPLRPLRARNLLAAGHYEEAIAEYEAEKFPSWKQFHGFESMESAWATAHARLGQYDQAVHHARLAEDDRLLADYLVATGRFKEAKGIADRRVSQCLASKQKNYDSWELREWLRVRACAEYGLKDYKNTVKDLEAASKVYLLDDQEGADTCISEANAVLELTGSNEQYKLSVADLPHNGSEKVLAMIRFLATSPTPFSIPDLNRIASSQIKLSEDPCRSDIYQSDYGKEPQPLPFYHIEYRSDEKDHKSGNLLTFSVDQDCCVPKNEVDKLFPANAKEVPAIDSFQHSASENAEAWQLPTGRLFMNFGASGAGALRSVDFKAPQVEKAKELEDYLHDARQLDDDESEKSAELLTSAINLGANFPMVYVDRAKAFCSSKKFDQALQDAKHAVSIGGRFYLDIQASIERQMGNYSAATKSMKALIGNHAPGPETSKLFVQLAQIQLADNDSTGALQSADQALVKSLDPADALFVKAKAEADLRKFADARADATKASSEYFKKAEILNRDSVLDWLKTVPTN